jgi:CHASE2 domain-containing sensor protein/predicted Ser/Thr protein kinase
MNSFLTKIPRALWIPAAIAAIVSGTVMGAKGLGWLESTELNVYDQATRWQTAEPTDKRILVVGISEKDIGKYKFPIADDILNKALLKLTEGGATVVGVDLVRDLAKGNLLKTLQESEVVIPICSHGGKSAQVLKSPPLPEGQEAQENFLAKVGFVDVPVDADGITRRISLFATSSDPTSGCTAQKSLALQMAESYLVAKHNLEPSLDEKTGLYSLGKIAIPQLAANDGGYQKTDVTGYPLMLKYRQPSAAVEMASLEDILENRVTNLKDRIVFVGSTASSVKDELRTPYSAGRPEDNVMAGVIVHAQATSQLISTALDGRSLIHFLPEWLENLLLVGFSLGGGYIAWFVRHPAKLAAAVTGAGAATVGTFALGFANALWMPVVSPVLGLMGTALATSAWRAYQTNQEQQRMLQLTKNQEQTIKALQEFLKQQPPTGFGQTASGKTTRPFAPEDRPILGERYQTTGILGSGGFATTYVAEDMNRPSRPRCAIKHLAPARRDPAFVDVSRRLFNTEAEILDRLGSHPQIPSLLAYFEQTEEFYLVQELIDGQPLDEEFANSKEPWPQKKVVDLLEQMLPVLAYIHEQRVIHRDIKPSNIMRRKENGQLVLIDFGAVKEINPKNEKVNTISIGTLGYTPPEQFAGRPNFTSDIYALGMTAIEAATNHSPRDIEDLDNNLQWRHLAPIDKSLADIIDKMVVFESISRYQSANEVLKDLQMLKHN